MLGEQTEPSAPRRAAPLSRLKALNREPARGGSGAARDERAPLSGPYRAVPPSRARLRPPPPPPRPWRPISGRPTPGRVPPRPAAWPGGAVKAPRSRRPRIAAGRPAAPRRASPERHRLRAAASRVSRRPLRLVYKSVRGPQCTARGRRTARPPLRPRFWTRCGGWVRLGFSPSLLGLRVRVPFPRAPFPAPTSDTPAAHGYPPERRDGRRARWATGQDQSRCQRQSGPVTARSDGRSSVPSGARRVAAQPCRAGLSAACSRLPAWPQRRRLGLLPTLSPPPRLGLLSVTCTLSASLKYLRGGAVRLGLNLAKLGGSGFLQWNSVTRQLWHK